MPPSWAHGGWAHKSRIAPIMIQQINVWKAARRGKTVALAFFDATNAFAGSAKESLNAVANECWERSDAIHLEDYHRHAHVQLQTPGGLQYNGPMQGGFTGHVWAPLEVNIDYQKVRDSWVVEGRWQEELCRQLVGRNPVDNTLHDTAMGTFVDDSAFCFAGDVNEVYAGRSRELAGALGGACYSLNLAKTKIVYRARVSARWPALGGCRRTCSERTARLLESSAPGRQLRGVRCRLAACCDEEGVASDRRHLGPSLVVWLGCSSRGSSWTPWRPAWRRSF